MKFKSPMVQSRPGESSPLIESFVQLAHLKQLYRQGWLRRGIADQHCESVADHVFGTVMLATLLAAERDLDPTRVVLMALVHDLGEAHAGDLTPADDHPPELKHRLEAEGVRRLLGQLDAGRTLTEIWEEYEQGETPEARFVRQVDKLEMALQAALYQRQGHGDLTEFLDSAAGVIEDPELVALLEEARTLAR